MRYQFYNHLQYLPTTICAIINTFIFDSPRPQSCCSSYYSSLVCGSNPKAPHITWSSNLVIPLGQPGYTSLLSHPKSSFLRPSSPHVCPLYLHYISPPAAAKTCRLLFHHTLELLRFVSSFAVRCLSFMAPTSRRLFAVTTPTHNRQRQRQRQAVYQSEPARARGLYYLCRRLRQISSLTAALSIGRQQLASRRKFAGYFKDHDHPGIRIKINSWN